jgi:hypothetical protein
MKITENNMKIKELEKFRENNMKIKELGKFREYKMKIKELNKAFERFLEDAREWCSEHDCSSCPFADNNNCAVGSLHQVFINHGNDDTRLLEVTGLLEVPFDYEEPFVWNGACYRFMPVIHCLNCPMYASHGCADRRRFDGVNPVMFACRIIECHSGETVIVNGRPYKAELRGFCIDCALYDKPECAVMGCTDSRTGEPLMFFETPLEAREQ